MKKVLLIAVVALVSFTTANAQKVGHINVAELVSSMPETKAAEQTIKSESELKSGEIKKMEDALQGKFDAFQNTLKGLSPEQQESQATALQTQYQGLQEEAQKIEELKSKAVQELQKKENELLQPIQEKAFNAIQSVANTKGLEYIIDSSSGVLVIANGPDILADVKKQLGL